MDFQDKLYSKMDSISTNSVKLLELAFIFIIIFIVVCKVTNYEFNPTVLNKLHSFIINKLNSKEEGLISYRNEISLYGLKSNHVDIVISDNISKDDISKMPCNHISNISPTNNFPMSTPNLKIDENGNIIPDDTFLKSNPFLISNNTPKKVEKKENPIQFPTIIVTLPNEVILPYSPKIPMDMYCREGWVDYSNPESSSKNNSREMNKKKEYDYKYLVPLIPKNHFSLKLQRSFINKFKIQESDAKTNGNVIEDTTEEQTNSELSIESSESQEDTNKEEDLNNFDKSQLISNYYIKGCVNEYAEEYELVNHAFWWQEDCNQQAIAV